MSKRLRLLLLSGIFLLSCKVKEYTLDRQDLFQLQLGVFEDEMDFFDRNQIRLTSSSGFVIQDGFFYVYNSNLGKIMKFSNNGDILSLIYTPSLNIPLQKIIPEGTVQHNFSQIELINVDASGRIYVVDRTLTQEKYNARGAHRRIIKVFSDKGNYQYFLGENGVSGEPFPFVRSIHFSLKDEATIISRDEESWFINRFSSQGEVAYIADPITESLFSSEDSSVYINEIHPSPLNPDILYINTSDFLTSTNTIILYHVVDQIILDKIKIEPLNQTFPYSILGNDREGNIYFYAFDFMNSVYKILLYSPKGGLNNLELTQEFNLLLPISDFPTLHSQLFLATNGLVGVMSIENRFAQFSWWRTDQYFKGEVS
ncbi:LIC_12708 family protein [Entomospira culicis]|uniref:Lipoprotein n=1 Tax=Entomospira culicis TaxID=2719989 RepID=A0A968KZH0_9SPIO|nr:hypothetical protein [Entomospira culicis]NIZ19122.1 hypothetical protein [Entomospira culicis]NIZ69336.1 hypothetical protein [Entomospira culicis]WDI37922.1 hypothetical protein PVA46_03800 [Entomospira culicis]WDI39549.1 hypothetical protein PVA47_03800 [Entomospira culicis]